MLERAHYVDSCFLRGVDPDTDEADGEGPDDDTALEDADVRLAPVGVGSPVDDCDLAPGVYLPSPALPPEEHQKRRRSVEGYLRRTGVRLGAGVGGKSLHDLVWGLLALDRAACVPIEGFQLMLVDYLHSQGVLRVTPCQRSARAALRKLVKHTPLVENVTRTRWRYRLDQLWTPSVEFLEAFAAFDAAGRGG